MEKSESRNNVVNQVIPSAPDQTGVPSLGTQTPLNQHGEFSPESIMPDFYSPASQANPAMSEK